MIKFHNDDQIFNLKSTTVGYMLAKFIFIFVALKIMVPVLKDKRQ